MTKTYSRAWQRYMSIAVIMALALVHLPALAAERPSDSSLKSYVDQALQHDERVDASQITVDVNRGIVKLVGEVDNLAARNFADQEAKKINGVLGVVNELYVAPSWRLDSDVAHAVRRRILNSADIDSQGITVAVRNGKVTLYGTVASYSERQQAGIVATETAGVVDVENKLGWEWKSKRSDAAILQDIEAAIDRNVYLSDQDIDVAVSDGRVTLTGSVGNALEKDKAGQDTWAVANVKAVDNKLQVEWWKDRGARASVAHRTDAELKQAILDELQQDVRIGSDKIKVNASSGHVTLDGSVYSHYQRRIAEQDTRDVVGVGWVTNNLFAEVDKRADWLIKDNVDFNLDTDFTLAGFDLDTAVKDGVVTLSGDVHTWYEKGHARNLALDVKGVRKVVNKVRVHYTAPKSDTELAKDVASRLTWNWRTWPVHKDITVTVHNGAAVLTGDVNSWAERNTAASVTFKTQGIWRVDNRLTVNGYGYPWEDWYDAGPYIYDPYYDAYIDWPDYYDSGYYWYWK